MTEEALLQRLRNDETAALEEIIDGYSPYVFSVLSRRLGLFRTPEDLEELASDVFFSLWRHRKRLRGTHLRGWLSKVAENAARDFLRRQRLKTVSAEDCLELSEQAAESLTDRELRAQVLRQALDGLDPQSRDIFRRYYYQDCTVDQIARSLDMNPATVKSRLQRGRKKLKEALTEGGITLED